MARAPRPRTGAPFPRRILAIDGERPLALAVRRELEKKGFTTTLAFDGLTGLREAQGGHYDVILLDLALPELNGFGVLAGMKARRVRTPVVVLTNVDTAGTRAWSAELGAVSYLVKFRTPLAGILRVVSTLLD